MHRTLSRPLSKLPGATALLVAFLTAVTALAQAPEPDLDDWTIVETGRFTVLGNTPKETLATVASDLERLHHVLAQMMPTGSLESDRQTLVYLFRDTESFAPFRTVVNGRPTTEPAYLLPREQADYAVLLSASSRLPTELVYKQYIHQVLYRYLPGVPLWLRHGLASFYSTFETDRTEARLGLLPNRTEVESYIGTLNAFTTRELLTAEEVPDGPTAGHLVFYSRCWLTVHKLLAGDYQQRRRVVEYIQATRAGQEPVAAFRKAFGMTPEELDALLSDYPGEEGYNYLRIPVASPAEIAMEVRQPGPAETAYRLGDLLLQLGPHHRALARKLLAHAAKLDPAQTGVWAGLGELAAADGSSAEATRFLTRAAEATPDDFRVRLALGRALLGSLEGRRPAGEEEVATLEQAIASLRRATEIRPQAGDAWANLGHALVLAPEPAPDAVDAMERALDLLPARPDLIHNLLIARARTGDRAGVTEAVEQLRTAGAGDDLIDRGREMELQLLLREAGQLARAERLDDAVALLAVVGAETSNRAVAEQANELLRLVTRAAQHNPFVEAYARAATLYRSGDLDAALEATTSLEAAATGERQAQAAEDLRRRIEMEREPGS